MQTNAGAATRPRVVIVRGHQSNPWELGPWEQGAISNRFDVSYLRTRRGWFDTQPIGLPSVDIWALRDLLPPGRLGDVAVRLPGDRYLGLRSRLRGADIVHTQELGYWYSMQAARLKRSLGFRLVATVWETIPFLDAYRNVRTRAYRATVIDQVDLFLAITERARASLLLEGAPEDRIRICPPGISTERFRESGQRQRTEASPLILSPGRLVWEKGHQDVLRAVALLRRGGVANARVCIVGTGPEERRLRAYARELGLAEAVEFRGFIPYDEMPQIQARTSCMVLASLPIWSWEEQFGMVLAEAIAAGTPILASTSGAIPEVAGRAARYFPPGDWVGMAELLAQVLAEGRHLLGDPPHDYSTAAAAVRIAAAYDQLLAPRAQ